MIIDEPDYFSVLSKEVLDKLDQLESFVNELNTMLDDYRLIAVDIDFVEYYAIRNTTTKEVLTSIEVHKNFAKSMQDEIYRRYDIELFEESYRDKQKKLLKR